MDNILDIEEFITPSVIRTIYLIGITMLALIGTLGAFISLLTPATFVGSIVLIITVIILIGVWRIFCECLLIFFSIHEKLTIIASQSILANR